MMCDLFHLKNHLCASATDQSCLRFKWLSMLVLFLGAGACGAPGHPDKGLIPKGKVSAQKHQPRSGRSSLNQMLKSKRRTVKSAEVSRTHFAPTRRAARWVPHAQESSEQRRFTSPHSIISTSSALKSGPRSAKRTPIAVIIPLSGRYRRWGRAIQEAFKHSAHLTSEIHWHFFDSEGDRSTSVAQAERAAHQIKAHAIIGPLTPWTSAAVSARARWYELPWFALGSFPPSMRHPFSFSWRLEAQDVAIALSRMICGQQPYTAYVLTDDRPRAQLTAQRLMKLLRRCGVHKIRGDLISKNQRSRYKKRSEIDLGHDRNHMFVRFREHLKPHSIEESALIILARGSSFRRALKHLIRHLETVREHRHRRVNRLKVYAGLGAPEIKPDHRLKNYLKIYALERPALSERGQRYVDQYPDYSTLALEIQDLTLWISEAVKLTHERDVKLSAALTMIKRIQGVWGQREIEQGRLIPTPLNVFMLSP